MKHKTRRALTVTMLPALCLAMLCLAMGCTQNRDGSYSITVRSIMEAAQGKGMVQGSGGQADDGVFQTGTYIVPGLKGEATLRRINASTYAFAGQFSDGLHPTAWHSDQCRPEGDTLVCATEGMDMQTGAEIPMNVTIRQASPGKLTMDAPIGVARYLCGAGLCFSDLEYIKK